MLGVDTLGRVHLADDDRPGLFQALKETNFPKDALLSLEYEANAKNPIDDMKACLAVAKEAIAFGVRVNTVAPGPTETGMAARTPAALRHGFADPRVRPYAAPEEIADIAVFLASDEAVNLVGAVLLANGGRFTI